MSSVCFPTYPLHERGRLCFVPRGRATVFLTDGVGYGFPDRWCGLLLRSAKSPMFLHKVAIHHGDERCEHLRHGSIDSTQLHKQFQTHIVDGQRAQGAHHIAHQTHSVVEARRGKRYSALEPIARKKRHGKCDAQSSNVARDIDRPEVKVVEAQNHIVEQRVEQPIYHQIQTSAHRITPRLQWQQFLQRPYIEQVYQAGYVGA